jgi:hypothetical protein
MSWTAWIGKEKSMRTELDYKRNLARDWASEPGWTEWTTRQPPAGILIELMRAGGEQTVVTRREELTGVMVMNVAGLWWRLTGIGRRQWEQMSPEEQA